MQKIVIISDNHGEKQNIKNVISIEKPDIVIHCGDFCFTEVEIKKMSDHYVLGNNDFVSGELEKIIEIEKIRIYILHGHNEYAFSNDKWINNLYVKAKNNKCNICLFGHSHKPFEKIINDILIFNPGSINYPRGLTRESYGIIIVNNNKIIKHEIKYV